MQGSPKTIVGSLPVGRVEFGESVRERSPYVVFKQILTADERSVCELAKLGALGSRGQEVMELIAIIERLTGERITLPDEKPDPGVKTTR